MKKGIKFLAGEKWKPVKALENINKNHYAVSNLGRMASYVTTIEDGYILKLKEYGTGYLKANIKSENRTKVKSFNLHIIMAETFLARPAGKDYVIHKDFNKHNNTLTNLKWVSREERNEHFMQSPVQKTEGKSKFKILPNEQWKIIKSLENTGRRKTYAASNMGRIVSFRETISDGSIMKPFMFNGYPLIRFSPYRKGKRYAKVCMVNRLVAECFLPLPVKGQKLVIHKDFDRSNNTASNLQWATPGESIARYPHHQFTPGPVKEPLKKFLNEKWMPVKSLEAIGKMHYMISSLGRLASYFKSFEQDARLIKGSIAKGQRVFRINIKTNGQMKNRSFAFHRMVAECFLPPPEKGQLYLIHCDYNKLINIPSNLRWVNAEGLDKHAKKAEGYLAFLKVNQGRRGLGYKLTESKVKFIKRLLADPDNKTRRKTIAKRFNIATSTLYRIKKGEAWAHVKA